MIKKIMDDFFFNNNHFIVVKVTAVLLGIINIMLEVPAEKPVTLTDCLPNGTSLFSTVLYTATNFK